MVGVIKDDIIIIKCNDWSRRLFDELIPLPEGTTYNSYIIKGSNKTALVDTADPRTKEEFVENLKSLNLKKIDYLIPNHAEQDHAGCIPEVIKLYPEVKILSTEKCKDFLFDFGLIDKERVKVVSDGEEISLGNKTLEFIYAPWVHWPETMLTYLREDKILFSCDFFGSHFASNKIFWNEEEDKKLVCNLAKRYYAEIMMPFRTTIKNHLEKLKSYDIKMIAPSHGTVYDDPSCILDEHREWTSDNVKNKVVLAFVSMHGSVRKMVEILIAELTKNGIRVKPFDLAVVDLGKLAIDLVDAATVIIAAPITLSGPHPLAFYASYIFSLLRPKTKFLSVVGSCSWSQSAVMLDKLKGLLKGVKVELIEPLVIKGYPKKEDLEKIKELAGEVFDKHKTIGIV